MNLKYFSVITDGKSGNGSIEVIGVGVILGDGLIEAVFVGSIFGRPQSQALLKIADNINKFNKTLSILAFTF